MIQCEQENANRYKTHIPCRLIELRQTTLSGCVSPIPEAGHPPGLTFLALVKGREQFQYKAKIPQAHCTNGEFLVGRMEHFSYWTFVQSFHNHVTSLSRSARATAPARLETPSLARTLLTCALAVDRLTLNRSAISGLVNPLTIKVNTSYSREVRLWSGGVR